MGSNNPAAMHERGLASFVRERTHREDTFNRLPIAVTLRHAPQVWRNRVVLGTRTSARRQAG